MEKEALLELTKLIEDKSIRKFVITCLGMTPAYFWKIPASSTGKYHPEISLGEGGLVRHTIKAVEYGTALCERNSIVGEDKDKILAALFLHDACKAGTKDQENHKHYRYHAHLPKQYFKEPAKNIPQVASEIFEMIDSHMGQWSNYPSKPPRTRLQKLTHFADYLASRKNQPVEDWKEEISGLEGYDGSFVL
ncbi:MAG: HD domain-containing protein [Candidatus Woesearchaeota archaeon]